MVRSVLSNAVQVENVYNIIKPPSPVELLRWIRYR